MRGRCRQPWQNLCQAHPPAHPGSPTQRSPAPQQARPATHEAPPAAAPPPGPAEPPAAATLPAGGDGGCPQSSQQGPARPPPPPTAPNGQGPRLTPGAGAAGREPRRLPPVPSRVHSPPHDAGFDLDLPQARVGHGRAGGGAAQVRGGRGGAATARPDPTHAPRRQPGRHHRERGRGSALPRPVEASGLSGGTAPAAAGSPRQAPGVCASAHTRGEKVRVHPQMQQWELF